MKISNLLKAILWVQGFACYIYMRKELRKYSWWAHYKASKNQKKYLNSEYLIWVLSFWGSKLENYMEQKFIIGF